VERSGIARRVHDREKDSEMKKNGARELCPLGLVASVAMAQCCACFAQAVPFAENGTLKMLYDNRMHPQAVEYDGSVYIVWRGEKGFPYIIAYDLGGRTFSKPFMLLTGMQDQVDARKYENWFHNLSCAPLRASPW
jgi:hypothetical protein